MSWSLVLGTLGVGWGNRFGKIKKGFLLLQLNSVTNSSKIRSMVLGAGEMTQTVVYKLGRHMGGSGFDPQVLLPFFWALGHCRVWPIHLARETEKKKERCLHRFSHNNTGVSENHRLLHFLLAAMSLTQCSIYSRAYLCYHLWQWQLCNCCLWKNSNSVAQSVWKGRVGGEGVFAKHFLWDCM